MALATVFTGAAKSGDAAAPPAASELDELRMWSVEPMEMILISGGGGVDGVDDVDVSVLATGAVVAGAGAGAVLEVDVSVLSTAVTAAGAGAGDGITVIAGGGVLSGTVVVSCGGGGVGEDSVLPDGAAVTGAAVGAETTSMDGADGVGEEEPLEPPLNENCTLFDGTLSTPELLIATTEIE